MSPTNEWKLKLTPCYSLDLEMIESDQISFCASVYIYSLFGLILLSVFGGVAYMYLDFCLGFFVEKRSNHV